MAAFAEKMKWSEVAVSKDGPSTEDYEKLAELGLPPKLDAANATLLDNVHPREHVNRDPTSIVYDLVAIGAGAGGLVSAKQTARRGGKSALIEMHLHGGDCLNVGCVPSKALISSARTVRAARRASALGVTVGSVQVNFARVMERLRELRAKIAPADAVSLTQKLGADVYCGRAVFTSPHTLEVRGQQLTFKKAVIATGGSAKVPPIPGLREVPYLTNRSLFNLTELPPRMVVVGAGPIGLEMAQSFALFGSRVTVLDIAATVLAREDIDASEAVRASLSEDGVEFELGVTGLSFSHTLATGATFPTITASFGAADGANTCVECEALLVATGRAPNVKPVKLQRVACPNRC